MAIEAEVVQRIEGQIAKMKEQRAEIDAVLVLNRQNVGTWLAAVSRACEREYDSVYNGGDIADGEIQAPWDLLQEAIKTLRETQDIAAGCDSNISEAENDLVEARLGAF